MLTSYIKVNLRDQSGYPEMLVARAHIVTVQPVKVREGDGQELNRADIVTVAGWTLRTTQTYPQIIDRLETKGAYP